MPAATRWRTISLNSCTCCTLSPGGVAVVGGEEADRRHTPVVVESLLLEVPAGDELMDGHELDGSDPELAQMVDGRRTA